MPVGRISCDVDISSANIPNTPRYTEPPTPAHLSRVMEAADRVRRFLDLSEGVSVEAIRIEWIDSTVSGGHPRPMFKLILLESNAPGEKINIDCSEFEFTGCSDVNTMVRLLLSAVRRNLSWRISQLQGRATQLGLAVVHCTD